MWCFSTCRCRGSPASRWRRRMLAGTHGAAHRVRHGIRPSNAIEAFEINANGLSAEAGGPRTPRAGRRPGAPPHPPPRGSRNADLEKKSSSSSPSARAGASGWRSRLGSGFLLVQAEEIIYASLADEGITVVTSQHAGTSNYRTLDDHPRSARIRPSSGACTGSHLVNINKIKEIVPWFSRNYILRMKDEKSTEIPVRPARRRGGLREYLKL